MVMDLSTDLALIDGGESGQLTRREGGDPVSLPFLFRRSLTSREVAASQGQYKLTDVPIHFTTTEANKARVGDTITVGGTSFVVLSGAFERLTKSQRAVCRDLSLGLMSTTIKVEVAAFTTEGSGFQSRSWSDEATGIPAHIQRLQKEDTRNNKKQELEASFEIYLETAREITTGKRIVDETTNQVYRVLGTSNEGSLAEMFTILVEEW